MRKSGADTLGQFFTQQALPSPWNIGIHAAYIPAEDQARVGGDWYDCFELPDGRLMVTIGDATGHGLDAAVNMGRARQILIGAALQETHPNEDAEYESCRVEGLANALLVLYTDGLIEHKRDAIDGERRLMQASLAAWNSQADGADIIRSGMLEHNQTRDDVAILTIRYPSADGGPLRIETLQNSQRLYGADGKAVGGKV